MLVLTPKVGEGIVVPHCQLTVLDIASSRVRLGVSAPPGVTVHRDEVQKRIATKASLAQGETLMAALLYGLSWFKLDDYQTKPLTAEGLAAQICTLLASGSDRAGSLR